MITKLAWRNLWRNKRRTLITTGAIFFAVMLSSLMASLQRGVYEKMIENMVGFYTGYVQVHQKGYWDDQTLDNTFEKEVDVAETIFSADQVKEVVPRLESFALAASEQKSQASQVVGTDPVREHSLTKLADKVVEGTYITKTSTGIMVAEGLAKKLELSLGDTIILLGQGYHGITAVGQYPIETLLHFGAPELNERLIYMNLATAQALYGAENRLTSYALLLDEGRKAPKVAQTLGGSLDAETYEVMDWRTMMPEIVQLMQADEGGNFVIMGILYMIIGFGIFGTVLMMTQERSYEFGVMVAVGMKRLRLGAILVLEMFFMALLGVVAGLGVTFPVALYFNANPIDLGTSDMAETYAEYGFEPLMPASLDPSLFLSQAILVFVITLLISFYPVWKISRLNPIDAMRS